MMPIVIPAYNPDRRLRQLVMGLYDLGYPVVVVNDGSISGGDVFKSVGDVSTVLSHERNRGKGQAIKTGIEYVLKSYPGSIGCVTADADGQHLIEDIERLSTHLKRHPDHLVLGVRGVTRRDPFRSWLGRVLMQLAFLIATQRWFVDTQTGLRGIPRIMYDQVLNLRGSRYELESEMIVAAVKSKIPIDEVGIATVYWGNNETSHFRTYIDFTRIIFSIYWAILPVRYLATSVASFCLDNTIFALTFCLLSSVASVEQSMAIGMSICVARLISGHFHYWANAVFVFQMSLSLQNYGKYVLLVSLIGFLSFVSTSRGAMWLGFCEWQVVFWKVFVEILLLLLSFVIQRFVVFRK